MSIRYVVSTVCFFPEQVELVKKALQDSRACVSTQVTELEPGDKLCKTSDVLDAVRNNFREFLDNYIFSDYKDSK